MKTNVAVQTARLKQFTYEAEVWTRMLAFFKDELAHYKTRLAGLLEDSGAEEDVLMAAETFQDEFLALEGIIIGLADELRQQDRRLQKDLYVDREPYQEVMRNQKHLRHSLKKADKSFSAVKSRYSRYLQGRYPAES